MVYFNCTYFPHNTNNTFFKKSGEYIIRTFSPTSLFNNNRYGQSTNTITHQAITTDLRYSVGVLKINKFQIIIVLKLKTEPTNVRIDSV